MDIPRNTVALLIDGDQLSPRYLKSITQYCESKGTLRIKNAYGDWNSPNLLPHVQLLNQHDIQPVIQNRAGDNATDFRMAREIGLMLDKREADIYVIVSNDGDFRTHCQWICESGAKVIVIGKKRLTAQYRKIKRVELVDIEALFQKSNKLIVKASDAPKATKLGVLIQAYQKTPQANGGVSMAQFGTVLRQDAKMYEEHFAGKRLSTWLNDFSHKFEIVGDRVRLK